MTVRLINLLLGGACGQKFELFLTAKVSGVGGGAWRHSPSAPMDTSLTPLPAMKSSALFTLEILCTFILPRSGLARRSPGLGKVKAESLMGSNHFLSFFFFFAPGYQMAQ